MPLISREKRNEEVIIATLEALHDLMKQDMKSFAGILPNFLNVWLDMSSNNNLDVSQEPLTMNIKIKALKCVENSVKCFEANDVVLERKQVLKKLLIPLDDRKRLVRRAASDARNAWSVAA